MTNVFLENICVGML